MTPTKRVRKKADDTPKIAAHSSRTSPTMATKRLVSHDEVASSAKKLKLLPEDTSNEVLDCEEFDLEDKFLEAKNSTFFADRTMIIKDFVEHDFQWIVDNKPHRFGKSTNVCSMVLYLSRFITLKNPSLFEGLAIDTVEGFSERYFKKCNVLYLNFRVNDSQHVFDVVRSAFEDCFSSIENNFPECKLEFNERKLEKSMTDLMRFLRKNDRDSPRFVFIDEYDSAFMELDMIYRDESEDSDKRSQAQRYAKEIYGFLDIGNSNLNYRFFLTGIACLEYGELFSDSRMIFSQAFEVYHKPFHQYHVISLEKFLTLKGFRKAPTKEEQKELLRWYGGYTFRQWFEITGNGLNLYSVVKCCSLDSFEEYFTTSGCTKWLRQFLHKEFVIICVNEILSRSGEIIIDLIKNPFLHPESSSGRDDILSLLVKCGYLVLISKKNEISSHQVKIPNEECRNVLKALVKASFSTYLPPGVIGPIRRNLYEAFQSGNEDLLREAIENFFAAVQGNVRYEETYGLLFFNAFVDFGEIKTIPYDTPAGGGKCDGVLQLREKAYVLEFKRCPTRDLPEPDRMSPEDYHTWCYNKGTELIQNAENQVINQRYMDILSCESTVRHKYRLLIACVQKRAYIKLTQVLNN